MNNDRLIQGLAWWSSLAFCCIYRILGIVKIIKCGHEFPAYTTLSVVGPIHYDRVLSDSDITRHLLCISPGLINYGKISQIRWLFRTSMPFRYHCLLSSFPKGRWKQRTRAICGRKRISEVWADSYITGCYLIEISLDIIKFRYH